MVGKFVKISIRPCIADPLMPIKLRFTDFVIVESCIQALKGGVKHTVLCPRSIEQINDSAPVNQRPQGDENAGF